MQRPGIPFQGEVQFRLTMGIHDRDYYRSEQPGSFHVSTASVVTIVIILNVGLWLLQIIFSGRDMIHGGPVTAFLACKPEDIFGGFPKIWKLVTAGFAHDWNGPWHLFVNMLFLFFFGRELERIYGRRDFWILYLGASSLGALAQATASHVRQVTFMCPQHGVLEGPAILGASAGVAAVLVVFTLYYPRRTILFFFFIPAPVWVLCVIFILQDILGITSPQVRDPVAHFAHLAGAGFGFLYKYFDWRWENVRRSIGLGGWQRRSRRPLPRQRRRGEKTPAPLVEPRPDAVSKRIDELLAKIHEKGMGSLTEEEREFLVENSRRYKGS